MAKIKDTEEIEKPVVTDDVEVATPVEVAEENKPIVAEEQKAEKPKKTGKGKAKDEPVVEMSERVKDILKVFSNQPELLITPDGRVFSPECKLAVAKAAILYKNPYYNS